jgi:hypothetical protein
MSVILEEIPGDYDWEENIENYYWDGRIEDVDTRLI